MDKTYIPRPSGFNISAQVAFRHVGCHAIALSLRLYSLSRPFTGSLRHRLFSLLFKDYMLIIPKSKGVICNIFSLTIYIILLGIKQLSLSIGTTSSHIQTIPPLPRFNNALSRSRYFFVSRISGFADFFISIG